MGQGVLLPKGETLRNLEGPRRGVFSLSQNGDSREQSGKPKVPNYNEGGRVFCHWRPLGLGWEGSAPPDCSLDWPGIVVCVCLMPHYKNSMGYTGPVSLGDLTQIRPGSPKVEGLSGGF